MFIFLVFILQRKTELMREQGGGAEGKRERERERERENMNPKQTPRSVWIPMRGLIPQPWDPEQKSRVGRSTD